MSLTAKHRLILSGTPMQNSLSELWSLFNFIQPILLGDLAIIKGGYTNATEIQRETSHECLIELREMI